MPNRFGTQQMRPVAWFLLFWSSVIGLYVARVILFDLYVRTHWHVVSGDVIKYEEKSALVGSTRTRRPTYWVEFEVEFDPQGLGCNTGSSWAVPMRFPCTGEVRSPGSQSLGVARGWEYRHQVSSAAKFYYDPATGRLRFAGESIFNRYPWTAILAVVLGTGISFVLFYLTRRGVKGSNSAPRSYTSGEDPTRDDLVDLKLP
ncbi:MAG TPA: hypothetical protein VFW25_08780 [Silvibacterium sp.]|nr:hypothetical protein [Silvibacterium sp.]